MLKLVHQVVEPIYNESLSTDAILIVIVLYYFIIFILLYSIASSSPCRNTRQQLSEICITFKGLKRCHSAYSCLNPSRFQLFNRLSGDEAVPSNQKGRKHSFYWFDYQLLLVYNENCDNLLSFGNLVHFFCRRKCKRKIGSKTESQTPGFGRGNGAVKYTIIPKRKIKAQKTSWIGRGKDENTEASAQG